MAHIWLHKVQWGYEVLSEHIHYIPPSADNHTVQLPLFWVNILLLTLTSSTFCTSNNTFSVAVKFSTANPLLSNVLPTNTCSVTYYRNFVTRGKCKSNPKLSPLIVTLEPASQSLQSLFTKCGSAMREQITLSLQTHR